MTGGRHASTATQSSRRPWPVQHLSDASGFVCFAVLAALTVTRVPEAGLLLLPTFAHELFVSLSFLIRDRPRAARPSLFSRAAAYGGTFLVVGFVQAARSWNPALLTSNSPPGVIGLAGLLWVTGSLIVVSAIWQLRYSFSIEPEARRVVRSGPYRFVRHPVYSGYLLQYGALALIYPSIALTTVVLIWLMVTLIRIRFEEEILVSAFPEYDAYRRSTGALLPLRFRTVFVGQRASSKVGAIWPRSIYSPPTHQNSPAGMTSARGLQS